MRCGRTFRRPPHPLAREPGETIRQRSASLTRWTWSTPAGPFHRAGDPPWSATPPKATAAPVGAATRCLGAIAAAGLIRQATGCLGAIAAAGLVATGSLETIAAAVLPLGATLHAAAGLPLATALHAAAAVLCVAALFAAAGLPLAATLDAVAAVCLLATLETAAASLPRAARPITAGADRVALIVGVVLTLPFAVVLTLAGMVAAIASVVTPPRLGLVLPQHPQPTDRQEERQPTQQAASGAGSRERADQGIEGGRIHGIPSGDG